MYRAWEIGRWKGKFDRRGEWYRRRGRAGYTLIVNLNASIEQSARYRTETPEAALMYKSGSKSHEV